MQNTTTLLLILRRVVKQLLICIKVPITARTDWCTNNIKTELDGCQKLRVDKSVTVSVMLDSHI